LKIINCSDLIYRRFKNTSHILQTAWAFSEHVESLGSELDLLEFTAMSEDLLLDSINGGLDNTASCLGDTVEIVKLDTSSAENLSVSEVLGSEITDR